LLGGTGPERIEVGTDAASPGPPTAILIVAWKLDVREGGDRLEWMEKSIEEGRMTKLYAILGVLGKKVPSPRSAPPPRSIEF
jgi:hypothetical protein